MLGTPLLWSLLWHTVAKCLPALESVHEPADNEGYIVNTISALHTDKYKLSVHLCVNSGALPDD